MPKNPKKEEKGKKPQKLSLQDFHANVEGPPGPPVSVWKPSRAAKGSDQRGDSPTVRESLVKESVADKIRARRARAKEDYPADNPQDSADNPRAVAGLSELLSELRLGAYTERADSWCRNMGAVHLDEVSENAEDFADALGLKQLEKKRLLKKFEESSEIVATVVAESPQALRKSEDKSQEWTFGSPGEKYTVLDKLGSGTTSTVYRCKLENGEQSAVKVMPLKTLRLQPSFEHDHRKLQIEAEILAALHHPNIVTFKEVVPTPDHLYMVIELITGGELFDMIVSKGTFQEVEARHVFRQVASAIEHTHGEGIIHRDLKPENILVRSNTRSVVDGKQVDLLDVALADFGVAKLLKSGCSAAKTHAGTPQYWAPEVRLCGPLSNGYDHRADIWSLGVILYVMLAGEYPFPESAEGAQKRQLRPLRTGSAVKHLLSKILTQNPEARLDLAECQAHPWVSEEMLSAPQFQEWSDWLPSMTEDEPPQLDFKPPARNDGQHVKLCFPLSVQQNTLDVLTFSLKTICEKAKIPFEIKDGEEVLFPKGVHEDVRPTIRELWQRQLNARPYTSNRRRIQLHLDRGLRHGLQLRPHVGEGMVVEAEPEFDQSGIEKGDAVVEIAGHPLELGDIDTIKMKFNENVKDGVTCRVARRF
jgi:serine/threonine protein kinase